MTPPSLIDRFGRRIDYIRLSVTDRCDFRCVYCMAEEMTFLPRDAILSLEELIRVGTAFTELGVKKIRITGGEPLVRNGILSVFEALGQLEGLEELTLTTNGSQLPRYAKALRAAGVKRLNISLDSLKPERFKQLTRTGNVQHVLDGIAAAQAAGFERIKLNAVVLKQRNDDEIIDLVSFALNNALDIAFIEEMPLGEIDEHNRQAAYMSSDELQEQLAQHFTLTDSSHRTGGPSRYMNVAGFDNRVGFISPHSHNFCGDCNRVRITVEGRLLLCLGNEHSLDLKPLLRDHPNSNEPLKAAIMGAMDIKPERHHFDLEQTDIVRFMNMTGG